ncbi:MAG: methionyl-tRNA formyltransferase, partial [Hyphomicrobium aestuarii]|nr:methionyl-tRNA formyltransferase [Hyphomicrobium aestuarii]
LIRATNPAPGAWATINGHTVDIYDSGRVEATGAPGEVLAITADGMTVAAGDGAVLIKRVRAGKAPKASAAEFAASAGIAVGARFEPFKVAEKA